MKCNVNSYDTLLNDMKYIAFPSFIYKTLSNIFLRNFLYFLHFVRKYESDDYVIIKLV